MIVDLSVVADLSDFKGPRHVTFKWSLKGRDGFDARAWRAAAQPVLQLLQCFLRPPRNYFNRSIREVVHVSAELESLGFGHDKPPEPHSLNAAPDNPVAEAQTAFRLLRTT